MEPFIVLPVRNYWQSAALGGCAVGQAKITKGYRLPAKYVIHTVGPIWQGGSKNEEKLLTDCYRNSLALAKEYQLESIAFPLISAGAYGYPKDQALKVAITVIGEFLLKNEMTVYLVIYDRASFQLSEKLFASITQYIDDRYVEVHEIRRELFAVEAPTPVQQRKRNLEDLMEQLDETFSQMLLRLIDEKGLTDAETYKKANIDRKLFSKIRNNIDYKPSKPTVLAFAIALELTLDETKDLLRKAGFAFLPAVSLILLLSFYC